MTSLVMILGSLVIAFPFQEAEAQHTECFVTISVVKDNGSVVMEPITVTQKPCPSGTTFDFDLRPRFDGLFGRCVGTNSYDTAIKTTPTGLNVVFGCNGPFNVRITGMLDDIVDPPVPHGNIAITVNVT